MLQKRSWTNVPVLLSIFLVTSFTIWHIYTPVEEVYQYSPIYPDEYIQNYSYTYPLSSLPPGDYSKLINLTFFFKSLHVVCNESAPFLLVLVHSSPKNYEKRRVIRETWGKENSVKLLYMLGVVEDEVVQRKIDLENKEHADIVQGNFLDSYRNITYKHIMVLKYAVYHCSAAKYVLKTDDDVFVNIVGLQSFLSFMPPSGFLLCSIANKTRALRSYRSKWRVSFKEYPFKYYPTYCSGWTILYSPDVLFNIYKEAQKSQYFWIDDVHVTGTLANKLHINHTNMDPLVISKEDLKNLIKYKNSYNVTKPFLYGRADMSDLEIRTLWKYCLNHPFKNTFYEEGN